MASTKSCGVGIKFPPQMLTDIDKLAAAREVSRAEIVRAAVSIGLPLLQHGRSVNLERMLFILEHTQLALSLLVERQHPGDVESVIGMAIESVEEFHA